MNIPIYPGSSSFLPGMTPFGFYDYDPQFQAAQPGQPDQPVIPAQSDQ